jgi:hypothetical protein
MYSGRSRKKMIAKANIKIGPMNRPSGMASGTEAPEVLFAPAINSALGHDAAR